VVRRLLLEQGEPHRIQDDVQVFQLVDEWHASLLQGVVHHGIPRRTGQEDHTVLQVGRDGHQCVVEVESAAVGHQEVTDYRRDVAVLGDRLQSASPRFGLTHGEAAFFEDLPQGTPDRAFVIDQENCRHALQTHSGG
jgi:hypothetical protein